MSSLSSSSSASNLLPLLVIYRSDASSASATVTQQGSNTLTNNESINGSLIGEADDNLDKNPKNTNKNGDEQIDSNGTSDDLPSIHIPKTLPRGYFQTRVTADSEEVVKLVKLGLSSATPPNVIIIEHDDGLEASRNRALSVIDFIRGDSAISITNSTNSGDAGVPENNSFLMASSNHSKNETVLSSSFNSTSKKDGASKRPQQHQQQQRQQQRHNNQNARSNHSKNSGGKGTTSNPLSEFHHAHHLKEVANFKKRILIILWSKSASRNIMEHTYWTNRGVNMISNSITSVEKAISMAHYLSLKEISNRWVLFNCTYCNQKLSLNKLHLHLPLLHGIENDISSGCPVCHEKTHNIFTHFLDAHPKEGSIGGSTNDWENLFSLKRKNKDEYSGNDAAELTAKDLKSLKISFAAAAAAPKTSSSSSSGSINSSLGDLHIPVFVLVVCRKPKDGKFLLVDELSNKGWYMPGGAVNVGEDLHIAAERKTLEETGVEIHVKGILRSEYTPMSNGFRVRTVFYAEPSSHSTKPKCLPDNSSRSACWIDPVELSQVYIKSSKQSPQLKIENFPASIIPLRSRDPYNWIPYVASGGAIWPISVLSRESDSVIFLKDPWNEGSGSGSGKPASNPLHVYQSPVPAPQRNTNHDTAVNRKISVFQENESKVSSLSSIEEPHIENPQDIPITQRSYSLDDKIGDDNNKVEDEEVGAPIEQNKV